MKENRSFIKFILLGLITFQIYPIVVMSNISCDINTIASKYDKRSTMHFCLVLFVFSWLTLGIFPLIWYHNLSDRIGKEQLRRGMPQTLSSLTFWGWNVLGSLIIVGPFIYTYKLLHAMNELSVDYNRLGY